MNLVLLGPPGAGKGTQAIRIIKEYNIPHISTGDIFREHIKGNTELGKEAKKYIDKGELVPDSVVIELVLKRLLENDCANGFLLDGFPRTITQADALEEFLKTKGQALNKALNMYVPKKILIERLSGRRVCRNCGASYHIHNMPPKVEGICDRCGGELYQRVDDAGDTVENRIEVYNEQTKPLISYYEAKGNIATLDGLTDPDELLQKIVKIVGK